MRYSCHIYACHELIGVQTHKGCVHRLKRGLYL